MNQNKIIMKLKILIATLPMLFPCMTACAAFWSTSPPTPVVKWPFDVSKRDSKVNQEFRIREYRSYYFALRFDHLGPPDAQRVLAVVGDGSRKYPGIAIPIHIKILKLLDTGNPPPELIYEGTISTSNSYAGVGTWWPPSGHGAFLREIIAIDLKPGIYRVEVNTIEDRPEFSGTPSYLQIEWHSNIKFLPKSIR